jgi:hypothetical protein
MLANLDKISRSWNLSCCGKSHHHIPACEPIIAQVLKYQVIVHFRELQVVSSKTELIDEFRGLLH